MRVGVHQIKAGPSWMDSIVAFLKEGTLPNDKGEAKKKKKKIRRKAPCFWLSEEQKLYKCSFTRPYLLCIHPNEVVESLLKELHEGVCGSRIGGRYLFA